MTKKERRDVLKRKLAGFPLGLFTVQELEWLIRLLLLESRCTAKDIARLELKFKALTENTQKWKKIIKELEKKWVIKKGAQTNV